MASDSIQSMVLEMLIQASSQNPAILKQAERKLEEWQIQPGFYSALYSVLINHSLDANVRFMSVVCLKNGIDKYWRRNAPNAMAEEERDRLKDALKSNFTEPVNQIAVHIAVLTAKISRQDCPKKWPELLPTILQAVENTDLLIQHRSLLTLHHVVKELASKRLSNDRHTFHEFSASVYPFLLNLWNNYSDAFVQKIMQSCATEEIAANLEKALLALRILRKLTIFGFYRPQDNQYCMEFMKIIFQRARTVLECRSSLKTFPLLEQCEKYIVHLSKVLIAFLEMHPISYIDFIQPSLDFVYYFMFSSNADALLFERFTIQCFNLMKAILVCNKYEVLETLKDTDILRANRIIGEFFNSNVLDTICKRLVSHYFILSQDDLKLWDADPEGYVIDESGETWKYSYRPCIECLFVSLFRRFRNIIVPIVIEMVRETNVLVSPDDMQGILRKDAVYNAVGLAQYNLYDEVDFDQWFVNTLSQELNIKHNNYRIIRRRVAWLIGTWTHIKLAIELRPALYDCILNLLDPNEDIAVRLTAAVAFHDILNDFDFNAEQFQPFSDQASLRLIQLLKAANECETKLKVLNAITFMVERCGHQMPANSTILLQYLPCLWQESAEHNMLRCGIVATFVQLVTIGCCNCEINDFLISVIQLGTDTQQGAIVYLLEDCLELWQAILQNSKTLSTGCMQVFSNVITLLDLSTENWKSCMDIIRMYLLLDPEFVIVRYGQQIVSALNSMMSDLRLEALLIVARFFDTVVCISPQKGTEVLMIALPRLIETVLRKEDAWSLLWMYLGVISRVLLVSYDAFSHALQELAHRNNVSEEAVLNSLLDQWILCESVPKEGEKLFGLAFAKMLGLQNKSVLQRVPKILQSLSETLCDVMEWHGSECIDSLIVSDVGSVFFENEHYTREAELELIDPVHTIVLNEYLQGQLNTLKHSLGETQYTQIMRGVNPNVISQMSEFITF